jgi:hypothetical protein
MLVKRWRDLIVTNVAVLMVLAIALLAGWWEAAAVGMAVLILMDLMVLLRERQVRSEDDRER